MALASDFSKFRKQRLAAEFSKFHRQSLIGPSGQQGPRGEDGRSVALEEVIDALLRTPEFIEQVKGSDGKDGLDGRDGESGRDGKDGLSVKEEDLLDKLLKSPEFKQKLIGNLPMGGLGISPTVVNRIANRVTSLENAPSGGFKYTLVDTVGKTTIAPADLIFGTNIIGVNASGDVEISLPDGLTPGTTVTVNDESLLAGTNNITITTYKVN